MEKVYSLRDLFDFEEGTVCFNDIYEEHIDNKANISKEWLDSKFILKS